MAIARSILIVEPDVNLRTILRQHLEDMEQNVYSAASAAEALALVEWNGLPDLVLVASKLSFSSGSDFLDALRDLPFYTWTPTFQLLAPGDKALPGVAGFLELPFSEKKIQALLRSVNLPSRRVFERSGRNRLPYAPVGVLH